MRMAFTNIIPNYTGVADLTIVEAPRLK